MTATQTRGPAAGPQVADVLAELRRAGVGEVDDSRRRRGEYSTDASLYRVPPTAVAFPRSTGEMVAAFGVCRTLGVPVTVRGAGTSIAGNAIGTGLVLDTSRYLNRVLELDPEAGLAVVEPGVVLDGLQAAAAPHGLRFGPDPSTHSRATLGGMIGNNACGSRALAYGRTGDNVLGLDLLAGTGERLALGAPAAGPADSPLLTGLARVVGGHLATVRTEFGRFGRQVSGYALEHLLPERGFDVTRAVVGSEGTLGLILGATVRLVRAPAATALVVCGYPDMAAAADDVPALLARHAPVALEGIDSRLVDVVRARRGSAQVPPLPAGGGWLLAELPGPDQAAAAAAAAAFAADASTGATLVITDRLAAGKIWKIREDGAGLAGRSPSGRPAYSGWEDAAVPPAALGEYLRAFDALLAGHGLEGVPYGHFGDGCLHMRIDLPLTAADGPATFRSFLREAAELVAEHGGSMSGEHGDGRARSELLPYMYSPAALDAMAAVKAVFDPADLLNPGILVRPRPVDADLRLAGALPLRRGLAFDYAADGGDLAQAVHRCTGVGKCRADNTAGGGVMCPSYLATRDERESTRGRARVLQEAVSGRLPGGLRAPELRESLDLCLSCKGCASDCPTGIDMATYKAEVLFQTYRGRLRPPAHYSLGWLPVWARLATRAPGAVNRLLADRVAGGLLKRAGGIDPRRSVPAFAPRTLRARLADRPAAEPRHGTVVLWPDTFTNFFTPEVGLAAADVLERAGYRVVLPPRSVCCGLTWISTGQLGAARRILSRTLDVLDPLLAGGAPLVGLEPSCTAVLRGDAAELVPGHPAVRRVHEQTRTLAELLSGTPDWAPPDLSGVHAVAQPHCHQHAVLGWSADAGLLARAGAQVDPVGGCCGLAGNFGVERGHHEVSVAVAETALLPAVRSAADDTLVLADGFSCRTQLAQLSERRGVHLAQLLADPPGAGDSA